jgi:hypothetical protein
MVTFPLVFAVKPPPVIATVLYGSPLVGVIVIGSGVATAEAAPIAIGLHIAASTTNSHKALQRLFIIRPSLSGGVFPAQVLFLM